MSGYNVQNILKNKRQKVHGIQRISKEIFAAYNRAIFME